MRSYMNNSPTCSKESIRFSVSIITSKRWKCIIPIDIPASLLGNSSERYIYIKLCKKASISDQNLWRLKKKYAYMTLYD